MAIRVPGDEPSDPIEPPPRPIPPRPTPPADPFPPDTTSTAGLNPSITSWTRLEPRTRDADMRTTLGARVFDPLWLLARQWQVGEFQTEDAGTPVLARMRATTALLSRCHLGELPPNTRAQAPVYDPRRLPLEAMVERQTMRPAA